MLTNEEKDQLDFLLSKNMLPYCMGTQDESYTCKRCMFKDECKVIKKNCIKEYILNGEEKSLSATYKVNNEMQYKLWLDGVRQIVEELKADGLSNEEIIGKMDELGYNIVYKESFFKHFGLNNT